MFEMAGSTPGRILQNLGVERKETLGREWEAYGIRFHRPDEFILFSILPFLFVERAELDGFGWSVTHFLS